MGIQREKQEAAEVKAEAATTGSRLGFSGHGRFSSTHCTSGRVCPMSCKQQWKGESMLNLEKERTRTLKLLPQGECPTGK